MGLKASMMGIAERQTTGSVRHVQMVDPRRAVGPTAAIYGQIRSAFGMVVPPLGLHSPDEAVLGGAWALIHETLIAGNVPRAHKEAVSAAVSYANRCPYCVDAHSMALQATDGNDAAAAIAAGDFDTLTDPALRALVLWAAQSGAPAANGAQTPFASREAPELIGTAVTFHYLNRMVHLYLDASPLMLPDMLRGMKQPLMQMGARMMGELVRERQTPGAALQFTSPADLPADLAWAGASPTLAAPVAGMSAVTEAAAARLVPPTVRHMVALRVAEWQGEEMGMSRTWLGEAVADLEEGDRPLARLLLLTAVASYRVDGDSVDAARAGLDDAALIGATAWAAWLAARRIGSWLGADQSVSVLRST